MTNTNTTTKLTKIQTIVLAHMVKLGTATRYQIEKTSGLGQAIHPLRRLTQIGLLKESTDQAGAHSYSVRTSYMATTFACLAEGMKRNGIAA